MKLAVTQIAWQPQDEAAALDLLRERGFSALEIAPTLVTGPNPYDDTQAAADYAASLRRGWGLSVCSMQSIWYGMAGSMFGPERQMLLDYTKKAVLFAQAAGCANLVFGCPKNRVLPQGMAPEEALPFFKELGDYAASHGASVNLEANPPIYDTNFINTTAQALDMVKQVGSPGFRFNLDFGTIIENGEDVGMLRDHVEQIAHVHISEPYMAPLQKREAHRQLAGLLREGQYGGYVSIEMKAAGLEALGQAVDYVAEVFG